MKTYLLNFVTVVMVSAVAIFTPGLAADSGDFSSATTHSDELSESEFTRAKPAHTVLTHNFDVRKYILKNIINFDTGSLDAETTIISRSEIDGLSEVELNFVGNYVIDSVEVSGEEADFDHDGEVLVVELPDTFDTGDKFVIVVRFSGVPMEGPDGRFRSMAIFPTYAFTHSEPFYARYWFPCFDEPFDKAEDGVEQYITVPANMVGVGNGQLQGTRIRGNSTEYHWVHEDPISTYLIVLVADSLRIIEDDYKGIDVNYYVNPTMYNSAAFDLARHDLMFEAFEELFGKYPFESYGVVMTRDISFAMENQTMTLISNRHITGDRRYEGTFVHELAHHWWGDAITLKDFKHIWLNESFATYSELLFWEWLGGKNLLEQRLEGRHNFIEEYDLENQNSIFRPNYNERLMFSPQVYTKGALVLHSLRYELGDELFFKVLRDYFERFKYSVVETDDFINLVNELSGKDYNDFFQGWLHGIRKPYYELSYFDTTENGVNKRYISVRQYQKEEEGNNTIFAMTVPIDPDGAGPQTVEKPYVNAPWFQFSVNMDPTNNGPEVIHSYWHMMGSKTGGDYDPPVLKSISRKKVRAGKTSKLRLKGKNFTPVTKVMISSEQITLDSAKISNDGELITLTFTAPVDVKKEKVHITIINPDGDKIIKKRAFKIIPTK